MSGATLRIPLHRHVVAVWFALIGSSLAYCRLSEFASGNPGVPWSVSWAWLLEAWTGWVLLSVATVWFGDRALLVAATRPRQLARILSLTLLICTAALLCEWAINLALAAHGWFERWESAGVLAYRRTPYFLIGSAALIGLAHLRAQARPRVARSPGAGQGTPATLASLNETASEVLIHTRMGPLVIRPEQIEALVAAENYVTLCLLDGREYLHRSTLVAFAARFPPTALVRIHRSVFVNPVQVRARLSGQRLKLASGRIVHIGRAFLSETTHAKFARTLGIAPGLERPSDTGPRSIRSP